MDFAALEIFIEKVFCGFLLIRREWVDFPNLRDKALMKVYFVIVRLRWGNMGGFFGEDRQIQHIQGVGYL